MFFLISVSPDIVEKLADKKNVEACKEQSLIYVIFQLIIFKPTIAF
jgi:hypothetical protein